MDRCAAEGNAAGRAAGVPPSGAGFLAPTHHRLHHEATATGHGGARRTLQKGEPPDTPQDIDATHERLRE